MTQKTYDSETTEPWHSGERAIQASAGALDRMAKIGPKVIRNFLLEQHQEFYRRQPLIFAGVVDPQGNPWATVLFEEAGFVATPDDKTVMINALPDFDDPAGNGIFAGAGLGLLGIEFMTRRRNRVNGHVTQIKDGYIELRVEHSMGNCPKYIQQRSSFAVSKTPVGNGVIKSDAMTREDVELICRSDSFFVGSFAESDGVTQADVSHRGGKPGFVRVTKNGSLTIPDFKGNLFFNTLGNIEKTRKAGLLFVDYDSGDLLQMTGAAQVILEPHRVAEFEGAQRIWTFDPVNVVRRSGACPLRWQLQEMSPHVLDKGEWPSAD